MPITTEQVTLSDHQGAILPWIVDLNGTSVGENISAAAQPAEDRLPRRGR